MKGIAFWYIIIAVIALVWLYAMYIQIPREEFTIADKLGGDLNETTLAREYSCQAEPDNVLGYVAKHKQDGFKSSNFVTNGKCGFYIENVNEKNPRLIHTSHEHGAPIMKPNGVGKFYYGESAKDKLAELVKRRCSQITDTCEIGETNGLCLAIEKRDSNEMYSKPVKMIGLGINENPIGERETKYVSEAEVNMKKASTPKSKHYLLDEYVVLPERLTNKKEHGGTQNKGCKCYLPNRDYLDDDCVEKLFTSKCSKQGLDYLKSRYTSKYDDMRKIEPGTSGISDAIKRVKDTVSYLHPDSKSFWMNYMGAPAKRKDKKLLFTGEGDIVDLGVENAERRNACYGEGTSKVVEGFNEIKKSSSYAISNNPDRLKYYQNVFRHGNVKGKPDGHSDTLCSRKGKKYPKSIEDIRKHWGSWTGANGDKKDLPTYAQYYFANDVRTLFNKAVNPNIPREERNVFHQQCFGTDLPPDTLPGIQLTIFSGKQYTKAATSVSHTGAIALARSLYNGSKVITGGLKEQQNVNEVNIHAGRSVLVPTTSAGRRDHVLLYYKGYINLEKARTYSKNGYKALQFRLRSDDGSVLQVNNKLVIGNASFWKPHAPRNASGTFTYTTANEVKIGDRVTTLGTAKLVPFEIVMYEKGGHATCQLFWTGETGKEGNFTMMKPEHFKRDLM